jgi:phosphoribosylformylglycinamidine cyclo-ligase
MAKKKSKYAELGVDAVKKNVREIFAKVVDNDYPEAFVVIINDPDDPNRVITQHMDGDGSKFIQRILMYNELGDIEVVRGAVDDAWVMNLGDIAASGFVSGLITITDVVDIRNMPGKIPKDEILEQIAIRFSELRRLYQRFGFIIRITGGETGDLPDQVKNIVFNIAVNARALKSDIIKGNVKPDDKIWGFASNGKATWEKEFNSGIMDNGLTLGRTYLMSWKYTEKYPFLLRDGGEFKGKFQAAASFLGPRTVSEDLISPTRHFPILIKILIDKLKAAGIMHLLHGISLNTGGGATKIKHVGKGIVYRKKMPKVPGIFTLIQAESDEKWRDMFMDFNCGVGLDIVGENDPEFEKILRSVEKETQIKLFELGDCKKSRSGKNRVKISTDYGDFHYY